jgi:hypothetical protein
MLNYTLKEALQSVFSSVKISLEKEENLKSPKKIEDNFFIILSSPFFSFCRVTPTSFVNVCDCKK